MTRVAMTGPFGGKSFSLCFSDSSGCFHDFLHLPNEKGDGDEEGPEDHDWG